MNKETKQMIQQQGIINRHRMARAKDIQRLAEQILRGMDTKISDNACEIVNDYNDGNITNGEVEQAIKDITRAIIKQLNQLNS